MGGEYKAGKGTQPELIQSRDGHCLCQLRQKHTGMRAQFLYHVKYNIRQLYDMPPDNHTAIGCSVDYRLEWDRFMFPPHGYEVCPSHWTWADMTNIRTNVGLNLRVPCPPNCRLYIWPVLQQNQKARHAVPSGSEAHKLYDGLSDMYHTVPFTMGIANAGI